MRKDLHQKQATYALDLPSYTPTCMVNSDINLLIITLDYEVGTKSPTSWFKAPYGQLTTIQHGSSRLYSVRVLRASAVMIKYAVLIYWDGLASCAHAFACMPLRVGCACSLGKIPIQPLCVCVCNLLQRLASTGRVHDLCIEDSTAMLLCM
jgi:hypothetical protein